MRFARVLFLCWLILLHTAAAQPVPADDATVQNLIRRHLAKMAAPTLYSSVFMLPRGYTPGQEVEVRVLRWENEVTACLDELQTGWEWLIRPGPRLDLTSHNAWDSSSEPGGCVSVLNDERSARYRRTHIKQDERVREKQGLSEPDTERQMLDAEAHVLSNRKTPRSLDFRWQLPNRADPGDTPSNPSPTTLAEVKQEIQRVAEKRRNACGPGEALIPRFQDDDPALIVYVQAGQGCKDFVIDIIPDREGRLNLGAIHGDWDLPSVRALIESILLERVPLP